MTTHTPGPWEVCGHPGDGSGTLWRNVVSQGTEFRPSYVCQALLPDAQLIAAAPMLLAVLTELARVTESYLRGELVTFPATIRQQARFAIQQANGEAVAQ